MLKRKISDYLSIWKEKPRKKSLVIDGPRQVGKTTSIIDFIQNEYEEEKSYYIDFKTDYSLSRIFKRGLHIQRIYQEIKLHFPEKQLVEGESVLFFDNIQVCPEIFPFLKTFTEDGHYDIIAAGSSLGIVGQHVKHFPIGYIEQHFMDSLDFEEYLWAAGYDPDQVSFFTELHRNNDLKSSSIHGMLIDLFREYIAIGGMPEVVFEYLKQNNFKRAYDIQRKILDLYMSEIEIHTTKSMHPKVVACFESIPMQLLKDNKKFQYRLVSDKGRSTVYKSSVEWLISSGIALQSLNLIKPIRPLHENAKKDSFKLYIHDTGLLVALYGENTQLEILKGNLGVKNGAVLENVIGTILHRNGVDLHYFEKNSTLEIDFVVSPNLVVTPLLVKEADNAKSKALKSLEDKYGIFNGLRLSSLTSFEETDDFTIPAYMAMDIGK